MACFSFSDGEADLLEIMPSQADFDTSKARTSSHQSNITKD
jgi:hypothetical protein